MDRTKRELSELSDLSSLAGDADDQASRTAEEGLPLGQKQDASRTGGLPVNGSVLSDASQALAGPPSTLALHPADAQTPSTFSAPSSSTVYAPPAPRSLSSALSSPGSPAASNSSDPTAETEPLPGSPRAGDLDDDDDEEDEDDRNLSRQPLSDGEEDGLKPTSGRLSPFKKAVGSVALRAPSAFPLKPSTTTNGKTSPRASVPARAVTASPKTALQIKQEELHALGIWKEEEGDSDLTPDEESDDDDVGQDEDDDVGQDEDDDDDDEDNLASRKKALGGKDVTPQPSANASTSGRDDVSSADEDEEDDEDEAEDDETQRTPNGTSSKKPSSNGRGSPIKSAPQTINGAVETSTTTRAASPTVPHSEELSPPPTSPGPSSPGDDNDASDDDEDAEDEDEDGGKTPTKPKADVRFSLIDANVNQPLDEEEEDMDDEDEEEEGEGKVNVDVPEVVVDAPEVDEGEVAGEADEVTLPDTPVLGAGENESAFPIALNLQAQQRMDAMEALSKIEIAFARMRDLMHLERMEECAREEEKLMDNTHPLLTQVQTRLTALRDRELSSIEARHVVARKESGLVEQADVGAIWEWWRNGREELQRDMMADVMRKRRRVDREKRAVEGGRPKRPLPMPPLHPPPVKRARNIDGVPDLEDLLPTSYLNYRPEEKKKMRDEREAWGPRPGLLGLDERGRDADLDMLGIGPSTRHQQHQPQMFRPFDGHHPPSMAGPPMHHPHHVLNQAPQPYHTLHPHVYAPPPHPADGAYLQNRPPYPYRPPIIPPYQGDAHLGHPQGPLQPHPHQPHPAHPPHQGPPGHHLAGLQPPFAETFGKPPASVVMPRPPPGSGGHHATGRAIMPSSSLPPNGAGPQGPEVRHATYSTFDMAFGGGGAAGAGEYHPPPPQHNIPQPPPPQANGQPGGPPGDVGSPMKRARTGSPAAPGTFRTLGIV